MYTHPDIISQICRERQREMLATAEQRRLTRRLRAESRASWPTRVADLHRQARTHRPGQPAPTHPAALVRRLSVTVAALAAAALALPACQGTAAAASHHHAAQATVQPTQNGLTVTDLKDLANMKRDLFQRLAQQTQTSPTITGPNDLANMKRDLFRTLAEHSPRR